jgi:hypothetical protein
VNPFNLHANGFACLVFKVKESFEAPKVPSGQSAAKERAMSGGWKLRTGDATVNDAAECIDHVVKSRV